jgi:glycosyltransferase involved in cell wall biosynthesis
MNYVLYDFMQVPGGAERVTLALAQALNAQVLVSRSEPACDELIKSQGTQVQTLSSPWTRWMGRIVESILNFSLFAGRIAKAETVIYSGFYAPMAVHFQRGGRRIYYCHTIPRFAYDLHAESRQGFAWFLRPLFDVFTALLRWRYERAIRQMDAVWVNSSNVQQRLMRYVGIHAQVMYPPVNTHRFAWTADGDAYVSLARLEPLKRVDVVVQAFLQMPHRRLVVVSGGSQSARFQALAQGARNITFKGWVSEAQLQDCVGQARAAIYLPVDEDFGMSPVEAMAAGKPVIGVAEGGMLETVVHGQTGWLIEGELTPQKIVAAVEALEALHPPAMRAACEAQAQRFDASVFAREFQNELARVTPADGP